MIQNKENSYYGSKDYHGHFHKAIEEDELNISDIVDAIRNNKFLICGIMLLCLILASIYVFITPIQYKTNALIQVEGKTEDVNSAMQSLDNAMNWQSSIAQPFQIEAALIHSRYILEPTIRKLGLNITAYPDYFPIIGRLFANKNDSIYVTEFDVPESFSDKKFYLTLTGSNKFKLYNNDNNLILEGNVGKLSSTKPDNEAVPNLRILVSSIHAKKGTKFVIKSKSITDEINGFSKSLIISDIGQNQNVGIQGSKADTGILDLKLSGHDPIQIPKILDTILYYEVTKNTEKKSAELEKTLTFLNQQLPDLKKNLDIAETRLSSYRGKKGSLGVNIEGNVLFGQLVEEEQKLEQAKLKKSELLQNFTEYHPYMIAINQDIQKITSSLRVLEAKVKTLPKTEQTAINFERDVTTKSQLYSYLLSKIQQLQIIKGGTISDVRILVPATDATIVPPKSGLIILASLLFGLILGIIAAFVKKTLYRGVHDPNVIEKGLGIPVYAMISHSRAQEQLFREMERKIPGTGPFVLATRKPKDVSIESLRSLRTTLQFALQDTQGNVITVLGGRPSIGKSFISLNLAKVIADSEQKVLLIDADLRKGKINSYFAQKTSPGFSEVLLGKISFEAAKRVLSPENFHFLPAGIFPENPSELLFNGKLKKFMDEIIPKYDIVIIDTPPVLAVTDAFIIAKYAAINLFVVGAGIEPLGAIGHSIKKLQQNGIQVNGFIFNSTNQCRSSNYCYSYEYGADTDNRKK